jgi:hypothetical protein
MPETSTRSFPWTILRYVVFFVLFFLWMWLRVDISLVYEAHPTSPAFLTGSAFFREHLTYPGGLVAYASALLSQAYFRAWAGALVVTLVALVISWATDVIVCALGAARVRVIAFVPAILMLAAFTGLASQLSTYFGPAVVVACTAAYTVLTRRSEAVRLAVFLLVSPALYYAVGGPYLLFAVIVVFFELLAGKSRLPALVALLAMEAVPYAVGSYLLALAPPEVYLRGLPFHRETEQVPWHLVLLLDASLALAGPIALGAARVLPARADEAVVKRTVMRGTPLQGSVALWLVTAAAVLLVYNPTSVRPMRLARAAREARWEDVLREARRLPPERFDLVVLQHVNRALYETGRLPSEMFTYPQGPGSLMVDMQLGRSPEEQARLMKQRSGLFFQLGDLDLRLGLVNEAEQEAHEALTVHGPHPEVLKRLALVNMVKGQPEAARALLNAMTHDLTQGRWAADTLRVPDTGSGWGGDVVRSVRANMLLEDNVRLGNTIEARCLALLKRNPANRMAFEYLMAYYLLNRQLDRFAENLSRLRQLHYRSLPRHCEEAILIYETETRKPADRAGLTVSDRALRDFADFYGTVAAAARAGDPAGARDVLARKYGNSYFFYHTFGESGVGER